MKLKYKHSLIILLFLACNFIILSLEILNLIANRHFIIDNLHLNQIIDKPWNLFLPLNSVIGGWITTGGMIISIPEMLYPYVGVYISIYIVSSVLIIITYISGWMISKSKAFTLSMTICITFGIQFNKGYFGNFGIAIYYLLFSYIELNVLFLYLYLKKDKNKLFKNLYIISLIFTALCFEVWLDYALALFFGLVLLYFIFYKRKEYTSLHKIKFSLITLIIIVVSYLTVKLIYKDGIIHHIPKGSEQEWVFLYMSEGYRYSVIAIEDVISNFFTYIYLSFSTFLPAFLVSSNSLSLFGNDVEKLQNGYHPEVLNYHFVYYHHIFLWYFYAGSITTIFLFLFFKYLFKTIKYKNNNEFLILTLILILILFGCFSHLFIKYRPYLSVPLFNYKCSISVLGVAYLLSFGIMNLRKIITVRKTYNLIITFIFLCMIITNLTKSNRLAELAGEVKMTQYQNIRNIYSSNPYQNYLNCKEFYKNNYPPDSNFIKKFTSKHTIKP